MKALRYTRATAGDAGVVAGMLGALLTEIGNAIGGANPFDFDLTKAEALLADFVAREKVIVIIARAEAVLGFIALYEGHAVYAGGAFGTISEFYVLSAARGGGIGRGLIDAARALARERGWKRLEVTTPPLPQFEHTLAFYRGQGFDITGGRKLKTLL